MPFMYNVIKVNKQKKTVCTTKENCIMIAAKKYLDLCC